MANEWNKTALVAEFETMLRRHLRSGAAPVAACAGFDLDAASAYLEGALDEWRRASYESHLAGCAICRRHLIELARLAQAAPSFEPQPVTVLDQAPAWVRWRDVVTGWLDISTRNLKWQIAGATGAAFAILIAALGVQSWRQASSKDAVAVTRVSASPLPVAEPAVQTLPSPTPEPLTQDVSKALEGFIASRSAPSLVTVPTPSVGPKGNPPDFSVATRTDSLSVPDSQPSQAPVVDKQSGGEAKPSPPPQPRAFVQINDLRAGASVFMDGANEREAQEIAQGPGVIPRFQPDLVENNSEPRSKPQPERTRKRILSEIKSLILPDIMTRAIVPFSKSDSDLESERKAKPDKQEALDGDTPKPMQVMIRGKIFDFKRGMLTDREYKPEMQKWNVWTLNRGSEQYKRALASEPLLKEFFDRAPILIVWKDRIYKVLK
jgi:putative zinc finger protein